MKKTIGTKLITYIKRLKLKIQSSLEFQKYNVKEKEEKEKKKQTNHSQKIIKYMYEVC